MGRGPFGAVARQVQRLFEEGTVNGLDEAQLLDRFLTRRDEVAFAALVARHGPMVLGVCRRVLGDRHDAEDAFQATFLVLARRADSIRRRDLLGPWLYRIARRVATRASQAAARRRDRERIGLGLEEPAVEPVGRDLALALQEELDRLPESYRRVVVLCFLEGLTHDEAARRLAWPIGTVKGRLARARELLRSRLTRRGITLSAAMVGTALGEMARAAVPSPLLEATTGAAIRFAAGKLTVAGLKSATAAILAEGVILGMVLHKLKLGALGIVTLGLIIAAGAGGAAHGRHGKDDPAPDRGKATDRKPIADDRENRKEIQGIWEILAIEDNGTLEDIPASGRTLEVTADTLIGGDRGRALAQYRIVRDRDPKGIDLMYEQDPTPGKAPTMRRGIYRLRGDRLDICLAAADQERPKAFVSPAGSDHRLIHLQRLKLPAAKPEAADTKEIQGHWKIVMLQVAGKLEDVTLARQGVEITAESIISRDPEKGESVTRYRLGPVPKPPERPWPRAIDLIPEGPPENGRTQLGICRLNGDTLMICSAGRDLDRPQTFESEPGSGLRLLVLKRAAKPAGPSADVRAAEPEPAADREALAEEIDEMRAKLELEEIELDAMKAEIRTRIDYAETAEFRATEGGRAGVNLEEREKQLDRARVRLNEQRNTYLQRRPAVNRKRRQLERLERRLDALGPEHVGLSPASGPRKIRVGDVLVIDLLEALPGRPLNGERVVRSDGTISLDFYGDLQVAGLDRREIKVKLIEYMRKYLKDDVLGLVGENPETHEKYAIPPIESDRVCVDDSPNETRAPDSRAVEEKLERVLNVLDAIRRERNVKGPAGP